MRPFGHFAVAIILLSGQTGQPKIPPPATAAPALSVKSSPASDSLNQAARDYIAEKKTFDDSLSSARTGLEGSQKDLNKQIQDTQKQLNDEVTADKKYKPLIEKIAALQKQVADLATAAQQQFQQKVGPVQSKMNSDYTLAQGLIPIVRKENGLPDTASFDLTTQTWKTNGTSGK